MEQFFVLINPVWDSSPVHTMTDFDQIHYLKTSLNNNMYTHTNRVVASKNNLASVILQSTKKFKKF